MPPSPGTGLAYGMRRVCAAWGMARSSFYAMTVRPARQAECRQSVGDSEADLGPIAAGGDRSRPGGIALAGRGLPKVWARLRVCRDILGCPQEGAPGCARTSSRPIAGRRGGNPHDGEIITHAPNLMWGIDGVRVCTVDSRLGLDLHRRRALERRVCRLASLPRRTASPLNADLRGLHWLYGCCGRQPGWITASYLAAQGPDRWGILEPSSPSRSSETTASRG